MSQEIWLQKYRPKVLDDVFGNVEAINCLKTCVSQGNVPNLILTGPPGVGKTSSVLCLARMLLGDKEKQAVKQLNASDERGIDVVRDQIKSFAQKKVNLQTGKTKIIILDEADSLTEGAQHALRMIISNNSETTRFVLSCNDSTKLIEPIQSRCVILRFSKLKDSQVEMNLKKVIDEQNVKISEEGFKSLLFISEGDMRQALNNLQACHVAMNSSKQKMISQKLVLYICDAPNTKTIKEILLFTYNGNITSAVNLLHQIFQQGYSTYDIINNLYKVLMTMENEIAKERLFEMLKLMAQLKRRVLEGLTTQLQVASYLAKCCRLSK